MINSQELNESFNAKLDALMSKNSAQDDEPDQVLYEDKQEKQISVF